MAVKSRYLEGIILKILSLNIKGSYPYEIRAVLSSKGFPVSEATIYGICNRLEKKKCIQADSLAHIVSGRVRKYYHITDEGIAMLETISSSYQREVKLLDQWLR